MATIPYTMVASGDVGSVLTVTWANMQNGDVGQAIDFVPFADRSVQVIGTFGAAGNARWEGSNNAVNYDVLSDPQGTSLDITSEKVKLITEIPGYSRPHITAGDGTTSLTVVLVARRTQPH